MQNGLDTAYYMHPLSVWAPTLVTVRISWATGSGRYR
jgi:hypothetical protein